MLYGGKRKQADSTYGLFFLMIDSSDHISGKTGLTPTVTLSKNGGSFNAAVGAVTEVGSGLYKVAGNNTDSATLGPLFLHATGTGADPVDIQYEIVDHDPFSSANAYADALLKRDWTAVSGEASRSALNALRALRNKVQVVEADEKMYVKKEDDTTTAWQATVVYNDDARPIGEVDPA